MSDDRERGTGRYKYTVERLCACGHSLAMHTAERVKHNGKSLQPCISCDLIPDAPFCDCECFYPMRS